MYTPDRAFVRKLKEQDRKLNCKFNGRHFIITYDRACGEPAVIWVVQGDGPDKGFRHPDQRDLDAIMSSNIERESPKEKNERVAKYMADFRMASRMRAKSNIRDMTKDNKIQLMEAYSRAFGAGKGKSAFRRMEVKPSKHTVTVTQQSDTVRGIGE